MSLVVSKYIQATVRFILEIPKFSRAYINLNISKVISSTGFNINYVKNRDFIKEERISSEEESKGEFTRLNYILTFSDYVTKEYSTNQ